MAYYERLKKNGVVNVEMESLAFAALTCRAGIRSVVLSVILSDRLETDQVRKEPSKCASCCDSFSLLLDFPDQTTQGNAGRVANLSAKITHQVHQKTTFDIDRVEATAVNDLDFFGNVSVRL